MGQGGGGDDGKGGGGEEGKGGGFHQASQQFWGVFSMMLAGGGVGVWYVLDRGRESWGGGQEWGLLVRCVSWCCFPCLLGAFFDLLLELTP